MLKPLYLLPVTQYGHRHPFYTLCGQRSEIMDRRSHSYTNWDFDSKSPSFLMSLLDHV